jgi:GPH family glycoside/pentoside/hexuronide:cation symporter|nr:MFS transporter [Roseburia sp.]
MEKSKRDLGVDRNGVPKMMRKRDYLADMSGQIGMNLVANVIGQLTYFYTDKVGLAVGGVGVVMLISKIVDALTDLWFGNVIDHSKGGNRKYYRWLLRLMIPYVIVVVMLFCVPIQAGQIPALIYACITNILLSAVCGTLIGTPMSAVMVVRTNSQSERESMGVFRAVGSYGAGMFTAIVTIPLTNILGGTQIAWIKYGFIIALIVLLMLSICYINGRNAKLVEEVKDETEEGAEDAVPLKDALGMLFKNKYWIILVLFNVITQITNSITATSGTYYCKWIFGNDNLVALAGSFGFFATIIGFIISKPVISKLGVNRTINLGVLGAAATAALRCLIPTNLPVYIVAGLLGSFVQIPLMCLYGVLLAMVVDYNEYTYNNKLVGVSSGAIGIGTKIGAGVGSVILTACLALGSYDATLEVATTSMRYAIYAFSNYLPLIINLALFFLFRHFDLEEKMPAIHKELARRREEN